MPSRNALKNPPKKRKQSSNSETRSEDESYSAASAEESSQESEESAPQTDASAEPPRKLLNIRRLTQSERSSSDGSEESVMERVKRGRGHAEARERSRSRTRTQTPPRRHRDLHLDARGRDAQFAVLYWGGTADDGPWDFTQWANSPRLCNACDGCVDTWRGRWDNVHTTFRMCGGEGVGFKKYMRYFMMFSSKASASFDLSAFYRWLVSRRKKALTERMVVGAVLEASMGRAEPAQSGIVFGQHWNAWEEQLHEVCQRFRREAGGRFAAMVLDEGGEMLQVQEMMRRTSEAVPQRVLIILGGPDGITPRRFEKIQAVFSRYTDFPVFRCSLPGGRMHSYYCLATVLMLHDQGFLLPFLGYLTDRKGSVAARQTASRPPAPRQPAPRVPRSMGELADRAFRSLRSPLREFPQKPRERTPSPQVKQERRSRERRSRERRSRNRIASPSPRPAKTNAEMGKSRKSRSPKGMRAFSSPESERKGPPPKARRESDSDSESAKDRGSKTEDMPEPQEVRTSENKGRAEATKKAPSATASPKEELAEKAPAEVPVNKAATQKATAEVDTEAPAAKVAREPPKTVTAEQPAKTKEAAQEPPPSESTTPPEEQKKSLSKDAADLLKSLSALQALQSGALDR